MFSHPSRCWSVFLNPASSTRQKPASRGAAIAADLDKFKDLFPEGSQNADDKALPQIWSDRAGFEAARNKARDAALALADSKDFAAFKTNFDTLGGSCKGCHDSYRAK